MTLVDAPSTVKEDPPGAMGEVAMSLGDAPSAVKADPLGPIEEVAMALGEAPSAVKVDPLGPIEEIAMALGDVPSTVKAGTREDFLFWLFIFCTLLMLASVIHMWSHWFEISAASGFYQATGALATVTGAALIVSWWLNTGNE
jgi:hypothetical protein